MATIAPIQARTAAAFTSASVNVNRLKDAEIRITVIGLTDAALQDPTLTFEMYVEGNDAAGGNTQGWYPLYGPDVWNGGILGKNGLYNPPGFGWRTGEDYAARRLRCRILPSRAETWGVDATVI